MKKIILLIVFSSFIFCKDLTEIKYRIKTVNNLTNDKVISNVELSLEKSFNKSIEMWGYVSELDSEVLTELKYFSSKPIFGLISRYQGKGNLLVFVNKNNENKIIKRDIFESEGDYSFKEEEKKLNNDMEIINFKTVGNGQLIFNKIKQERTFIFDKSYLIIYASKDYLKALKKAKEIQQKIGMQLNINNYEYFKTTGLLNNKYNYIKDFY